MNKLLAILKLVLVSLKPVFVSPLIEVLDNPAMRTKAIELGETAFDKYIEPIDLPGPDSVTDPLLRSTIGLLVGPIYDGILKELKEWADA